MLTSNFVTSLYDIVATLFAYQYLGCNARRNILCNDGDWSTLSGDGGTWTFYNYDFTDYNNCSVQVTSTGSSISRLWLGSSDGTTYDSSYSYTHYEYVAYVTMTGVGDTTGYSEFGLFHRLTSWDPTANTWSVGSGFGLFLQTPSGGRVWNRVIESTGSTDIGSPVTDGSIVQNSLIKVSIKVDVTNSNIYDVYVNDVLVFDSFDTSTYGYSLASGSIGIWSYYTELTVHKVYLRDLDVATNSPTLLPTDPTDYPTLQPTIPTKQPTDEPSNEPTDKPTAVPSKMPSDEPTADPTDKPSDSPSNEPSKQPSTEPTDKPSDSPSTQPTNEPTVTNAPSNEPSNEPSDRPTTSPSDMPSDEPSASEATHPPSGSPSKVPSDRPSDSPTKAPSSSSSGSGSGSDASNTNNGGSDSSIFENDTILIVLIICSFLVCVIFMILMYFYFDRRHKRKKKFAKMQNNMALTADDNNSATNKQIELKQLSMRSTSDSGMGGGDGNGGGGPNTYSTIDIAGRMMTNSNPNPAGEYNPNDDNNNYNNNGGGSPNSPHSEHDDLLAAINTVISNPQPSVKNVNMVSTPGNFNDIFADLENGNNNNNNNNHGNNDSDEDEFAGEGFGPAGGNGVTGAPPGHNNVNNMDTSAIMAHARSDLANTDDVANKMTQKDVLLLVKNHLIKNGFENDVILTFLKEFANKNVTGRDMIQFKKNPKLLDAFQMKFSKDNQVLSIWLTVHMIVNEIGK